MPFCLPEAQAQLEKRRSDLWHSRWTLASVFAYRHCFSLKACFLCGLSLIQIGSDFQFRILLPTHLNNLIGLTLDLWGIMLWPDLGFRLVLELWGLEPAGIVRGHRICNAVPGHRISEASANHSRNRAIHHQ